MPRIACALLAALRQSSACAPCCIAARVREACRGLSSSSPCRRAVRFAVCCLLRSAGPGTGTNRAWLVAGGRPPLGCVGGAFDVRNGARVGHCRWIGAVLLPAHPMGIKWLTNACVGTLLTDDAQPQSANTDAQTSTNQTPPCNTTLQPLLQPCAHLVPELSHASEP